MSKQFFALKSSLPMLRIDAAPPVSSDCFLGNCRSFMNAEQLEFLRGLSLHPRQVPDTLNVSVMKKYAAWEICLRNTLAVLRANKLNTDASPYIVAFAEYESSAAATAQNVFVMNADPLEKELFLDHARWNFLESMEWNHVFDFNALCLYRCKLLILEKWAARNEALASANLDAAADRSEQNRNNNKL